MTTPSSDEPAATPAPEAPAAPPPPPASTPAGTPPPRRRLTRSRTDSWLGGVAGGLAEYWDTDPTVIRIAMVVLAFITSGVAVAGYIVAWIVIPEADTAAEGAAAEGSTPRTRSGSAAGIVWGVVLVVIGTLFLLAQLDINLPRWEVTLAGLLILLGVLILVEGRRRMPGGLVVLGIILTAVLGASHGANLTMNVDSGFGDRTARPTSVQQLEDYSHAFGSMVVDLRQLEVPQGTTAVKINIAFGSVDVRLPEGVAYRINSSGAFSSINAPGRNAGGIVISEREWTSADYGQASHRLDLDISVAFGSAEVR